MARLRPAFILRKVSKAPRGARLSGTVAEAGRATWRGSGLVKVGGAKMRDRLIRVNSTELLAGSRACDVN